MYFIHVIKSAILFHIALSVQETTAAENGYIIVELPSIKCLNTPSGNSEHVCSLDYKTADTSSIPNFPDKSWSAARELLINAARALKRFSNERCRSSGVKYLCEAAHPLRCDENSAYVETKKLVEACNKGKSDCASLNATLRDSFFDCSLFANNTYFQERLLRKFTCEAFPELQNDPYSCQGNYKVYSGNATVLKEATDALSFVHKMLKRYSNVTDAQCQKNVADVACKAAIPACSKDRTKLVQLISKQECYKTVGCVNKTNIAGLIQGANELCQRLLDTGTAKRYPLDNVYDNKAANHAVNFSTILLVATIVVQSFR